MLPLLSLLFILSTFLTPTITQDADVAMPDTTCPLQLLKDDYMQQVVCVPFATTYKLHLCNSSSCEGSVQYVLPEEDFHIMFTVEGQWGDQVNLVPPKVPSQMLSVQKKTNDLFLGQVTNQPSIGPLLHAQANIFQPLRDPDRLKDGVLLLGAVKIEYEGAPGGSETVLFNEHIGMGDKVVNKDKRPRKRVGGLPCVALAREKNGVLDWRPAGCLNSAKPIEPTGTCTTEDGVAVSVCQNDQCDHPNTVDTKHCPKNYNLEHLPRFVDPTARPFTRPATVKPFTRPSKQTTTQDPDGRVLTEKITTRPEKPEEDNLIWLWIILVCVGVLLLVGLVITIWLCVRRRQRRQTAESTSRSGTGRANHPRTAEEATFDEHTSRASHDPNEFKPVETRNGSNELTEADKVQTPRALPLPEHRPAYERLHTVNTDSDEKNNNNKNKNNNITRTKTMNTKPNKNKDKKDKKERGYFDPATQREKNM